MASDHVRGVQSDFDPVLVVVNKAVVDIVITNDGSST